MASIFAVAIASCATVSFGSSTTVNATTTAPTESQFPVTGYTLSATPTAIVLGQGVEINGSWYGGTAPYNATLYGGQSASCSSDTTPLGTVAGKPGGTLEIGSPVLVYRAIFYGTPNATGYYCITVKDANSETAEVSSGAVEVTVVPKGSENTTTAVQVPNVTTTFTEVGLPPGSDFTVRMNGLSKTVAVTTTNSISFSTSSGAAFSYAISAVSYNGVVYTESTSQNPKLGGSVTVVYSPGQAAGSTATSTGLSTMPSSAPTSASTTVGQQAASSGGILNAIISWLRNFFGSL